MITDADELKKVARMRPPHKESLAYMLARTLSKTSEQIGPPEVWQRDGEYKYQSWEPIFTDLETATHAGIDDASVIRALYGTEAKWDWQALFGADNRADAKSNFVAMRRHAIYMFMQPTSVATLDDNSYPDTYKNKDVAKLFNATASAKDRDAVGARVQATAQILFRILYGNTRYSNGQFFETRTLFSSFTLGHVHRVQLLRAPFKEGMHYYFNQGALAWTLLTFSYFIAKAWQDESNEGGIYGYSYSTSGFQEGQWYRFWAIVGSCMGIANELLPKTHSEAEALYFLFQDANLSDRYVGPLQREITNVYKDKREPTAGEFAKLLKWVPQYFGSQWTHPLSWASYGLSTGLSTASSALTWLKKKTIG